VREKAMELQNSLAIILCSYNRKMLTERCIKSLKLQCSIIQGLDTTFYVFDDGSTDGTPQMLKKILDPRDVLMHGNGKTFWNRSMYQGMKRARLDDPDYYLMVNDDVNFADNAIEIMLQDFMTVKTTCGVVGSTAWEGQHTYGGRRKNMTFVKPIRQPAGNTYKLLKCYYANWNCFLTERKVIECIGLIDRWFGHGGGDFDYSRRMAQKGIPIYVAHAYIGTCKANASPGYYSAAYTRKQRLKEFFSPKGMPFVDYVRAQTKTYGMRALPGVLKTWMGSLYRIIRGMDIPQ
jgi:GT2 family glycosyltransferase